MNKKQRKMLFRIIIAAVFLVLLNFIPVTGTAGFLLYLIPYLVVGYDILWKALKGIKNHQVFDENFLMAVATIGAIALALYEKSSDYTEAIAVMLFYQIGEWFQSYAVGKSRRNISELMDIRPDYANIEKDGRLEKTDPDEVETGSVIVVQPGEKVPIDGIVEEGESSLNTSALTGESLPRDVEKGDEIISGCINMTGVLKIRTTKEFGESTVSKILDLVENASSRKSKSEDFISRFARIYTPAVCCAALALAFLPPLVRMLGMGTAAEWGTWIYRALTFLVISCPCALVISIPLSFFAGIGGAGNAGVLVKGSNYLETLSQTKIMVFDKTGTLTKGVFEVIDVIPSEGFNKKEVLVAALCAQNLSNHPIAQSIKKTYQKLAHNHTISEYEELSGLGVRAVCDSHEIIAGNDKILHAFNIAHDTCYVQGSVVHIVRDKQYLGYILIADVLKNEAIDVIATLKNLHIDSIILSGDGEYPCKVVADKLGCAYYHSLLPQDKAQIFASIKTESNGKVAFVGDGINDAPTLALADVGVAMGSGSDISHKSADVIIANNSLQTLVSVIRIAKKTKSIIYQNIAFALGIKGVFIVLGLFGLAGIWEAVFADVGVALLALANAMRCMRV